MTAANFDRSLRLVLVSEGGYVNDPRDPGGATNKGITLATFRQFIKHDGTVADLKALTVEQAGICYRANYWNKVHGDELPAGLDYVAFDFCVNSGPNRAVHFLQTSLGVESDGDIGPATLVAAHNCKPSVVINDLCDRRLAWLRHLGTWQAFGKGWTRRIESVRKDALAMAAAPVQPIPAVRPTDPSPEPSPAPTPVPVPPVLHDDNSEADPVAVQPKSGGFDLGALFQAIVAAIFGKK